MKSIIKNSALILLAIIGLVSCETKVKREDITPTSNSYKNAVERFFSENAVDSQQFVINTNNTTTVIGEEGTIITIPAYAFEFANGNPVTGNVTINIKEIFDKSDMVFSGVTTQSNGQILISGGELFISAYSNGQEVYLNESASIDVQVEIDGSVDPNMDLFVGDIDTSGNVNWNPVDTSNFVARPDSINQMNWYYTFSSNTLGWLNCDYFYNQANTTLSVTLPSLDDLNGEEVKQTGCFVIYKDINSVTRLYDQANCQATSCPVASFSGLAGLNEPVIILTVADIGGSLHYNKQEVTITSNLTITLDETDLIEVSEEQLQSIIDSF
jgi:hypothetical protein